VLAQISLGKTAVGDGMIFFHVFMTAMIVVAIERTRASDTHKSAK
jgi:hypothetical protein